MWQPSLIIFDCDGVLIDSEVPSMRALMETLGRRCGIRMSFDAACEAFVGKSEASMIAYLKDNYNVSFTAELREEKEQYRRRLFETELKAMLGVTEMLDRLTIPVCIASSSSPERLQHSLNIVGLWNRFAPHIFSATQVKRGKPAPDLFLFAAKQMGVSPSECLVIEDATAGVKAAKAAGMEVYGFSGGGHCGGEHAKSLLDEGAVRVFKNMSDLSNILSPSLV